MTRRYPPEFLATKNALDTNKSCLLVGQIYLIAPDCR
jgi:hypothetical protein